MRPVSVKNLSVMALDYAVSVALGHKPVSNMKSHGHIWSGWWEQTPVTAQTMEYRRLPNYSGSWEHAGPIIEREEIDSYCVESKARWQAEILTAPRCRVKGVGSSPLTAAMRCFVRARLGENVEIPLEILEVV